MPFYIKFGTSVGQNFGKGRVYGMKLGMQTLTPRNLRFMIQSPRDISTGQASGSPQPSSITVTKDGEDASAQLRGRASRGGGHHEIHIDVDRVDSQGITQPYGRLTLTDAFLVRYTRKPIPMHRPGHSQYDGNELEEVEFTFQRITWTSTTASTSAQDDWSKQ